MDILNAQELREKLTEKFNSLAQQAGFQKALTAFDDLSRALKELNNAGVNVGFTPYPWPTERTFDLSGKENQTMQLSGILTVGHNEYLLGVQTIADQEDCLVLFISNHDIRYPDDAKGKIRSSSFDIEKDPDAMKKFQIEIAQRYARILHVNEHDPASMFDRLPGKVTVYKP